MDRQISRVRSFNRAVTRRIGALNDDFMGRHRPLGESRLLFEIGPGGQQVRHLRARLGLDSGYASRMLQSLETQGLIRIEWARDDARKRVAHLTAKGRKEVTEIDRLSDRSVQSVLQPLSPRQRERLVTTMAEAERLLDASAVVIAPEKPSTTDAHWCVDQYFGELDHRFSNGFDPGQTVADDIAELTPPAGWLLLARIYDEPVGCGALRVDPAGYGEIKRVWIAERMRGLGVGRRLLAALERQAQEAGLSLLRLDTNGALSEAQALYRSNGYSEIGRFNDNPYAHHWFEKRLL